MHKSRTARDCAPLNVQKEKFFKDAKWDYCEIFYQVYSVKISEVGIHKTRKHQKHNFGKFWKVSMPKKEL